MNTSRLKTVRTFLFLALMLAPLGQSRYTVKGPRRSPLLVVSFDAFRPDYLDRGLTPHLSEIRRSGPRADYMRNVFPTKTFPNHFSIATGLYAGAHGVTGNKVFDTRLDRELSYGYELFHQSEDVVPIWTFAEMCGLHAGCMMWPGSDFPYGENVSCTYTTNYNHSLHYTTKVDTVIGWMTSEELPASLVMLYFDEPDFHGHIYSPESDEVRDMIIRTDQIARYITEQLTSHGLIDRVNIVYLSDHGMDTVQSPNFIDLTALMTPDTFDIYSNTPVMQIVPRPGFTDQVLRELSEGARQNGHFRVYTAETLPERWNIGNAQRTGPITAVADVKYAFQDMWQLLEYYKKAFNISLTPDHKYGMHGYDNAAESMHAIFMANGPAFVENYTMDPFDSVELYRLFGLLLGMDIGKMPPNNGTCTHGLHILRQLPTFTMCYQGLIFDSWMLILLLSCLVSIMLLILMLTTRVFVLEDAFIKGRTVQRKAAMRPVRVIKRKVKAGPVTLL